MNNDDFDKELSDLYQQRKAQIRPVDIKLDMGKNAQKSTPLKTLVLLMGGGLFSVATFAVMTLLIEQPSKQVAPVEDGQTVTIALDLNKQTDEAAPITVKQQLPEKPTAPPIPALPVLVADSAVAITPSNIFVMQSPELTIAMPSIDIHHQNPLPIYRELPELPTNEHVQGAIKMSYTINKEGRVININKLESSVSNGVVRETKKSLSNWRYAKSNTQQENIVIIFEFSQN